MKYNQGSSKKMAIPYEYKRQKKKKKKKTKWCLSNDPRYSSEKGLKTILVTKN